MTASANSTLRSFIPVSPDSHFPIQNLPFGVFCRPDKSSPRVGVAIGDMVLDLAVLADRELLDLPALTGDASAVFAAPSLNRFMSLGRLAWSQVRQRLTQLLREDEPTLRDNTDLGSLALVPQAEVKMLLPAKIGDYTDFYSSRDHATNVGTMLRGADNALMPNWLHLPVAYHGRASSVVVSGTDLHRPRGQTKSDAAPAPSFGPSQAVDFELEMALFIGPGNALGDPIPVARAADHIFGLVLMNDWSARDIQKWEYAPLGPFLSKNFGTSISPWVVTLEALEPFRVAGPAQDPAPLEYLQTQGDWAYDIPLEVSLQTSTGPESTRICASNFRHLYWNICQQVAHHTVNGCNLQPGDLLGSGTISGPTPDSRGCLLELSWGGRNAVKLSDGQTRRFLLDGDRVTMTGWCQGAGYRVGFGEVTGRLLPVRDRVAAVDLGNIPP
jgi:fumarylacetoacetase